MQIKLPDDYLSYAPIYKFSDSADELTGIDAPSGTNTEGMQAAQSFLSVYREFSDVLKSYVSLITYDGERIRKIVESFAQYDQSN